MIIKPLTAYAVALLRTCPILSAQESIPARWKPLDNLATTAVASPNIPGDSVCVVANGNVLFNRAVIINYHKQFIGKTNTQETQNTPDFNNIIMFDWFCD